MFKSITIVILTMIIERPNEVKGIKEIKKWVLIYGRRKTGKSFIVQNFIHYDDYFFVKKDRSILSNSNSISHETFLELLKRDLAAGSTVVVDEFHRLGEDFFDFLHQTKKSGKLILVSSTLFLSKKLFSSKSALLGFFAEFPIGLISLEDVLSALRRTGMEKKSLLETAILLREPIAIDYFDEKYSPREAFAKILLGSVKTIPALVGEIFMEEERTISAVYEGILRAIANGNVISGEISSHLFARGLLKKDDPSTIQQYLNNLVAFGIIRKLKVYGKDRFVYKHTSPLARLFYYADEKYNISERTLTEIEIRRIIDELMPRLIEDNVREFAAARFGLEETIAEAEDHEVDACLLRFKKPKIAMEIKWKDRIGQDDIVKAERNLERVPAEEKLLFVPDKEKVGYPTSLKVVDISDIISLKR